MQKENLNKKRDKKPKIMIKYDVYIQGKKLTIRYGLN